jgi:hypothetical protein
MKKMISGFAFTMVLVFSSSIPSLAGGEITRSFKLTRESKISGQVLKEGDYSVKFMDDKEGELIVLKGKKEVVKANYKFKPLTASASENAVAYTQNGDGVLHLIRIEFKGMKSALIFE